jgi:oxygen-independent coproporphyrinogen-3 oxidase
MDHFARPDDELARAQREGSLYRNFQGYSTHAECDLIGLGVTSIGMVGNSYAQNFREMDEYTQSIDAGHLPVFRGIALSQDDLIRRTVITELICHFALDFQKVENQFDLKFSDYFASELEDFSAMVADGLIEMHGNGITVLPAGRLLIRNVCMVFDRYLREKSQQRFSRVI